VRFHTGLSKRKKVGSPEKPMWRAASLQITLDNDYEPLLHSLTNRNSSIMDARQRLSVYDGGGHCV
jgi:hypothetical protein